ncbi:hypothetical protein D0Z70_03910 [Sphingobium terrigena]|uniref:Uncharacterized protein n=1 Tax=Sphingobium terrigena TaxID=2304063 RepID=A0A418YXI3_9SPHN|nr:hypothetical protein D0Z70_03910 [Sphingobium terrigena]
MPILCLAFLTPGTAHADDIGSVRKKVAEFTASTKQRPYDLERCIIDTDNIGKPWVYGDHSVP